MPLPKDIPAFDVPLEVELIDGEIVVTGPDGFCGSFTHEAAEESARRLSALTQPEGEQIYQKPLG